MSGTSTVEQQILMIDVFLDAAYAIALASTRDQYHERALELEAELAQENVPVVTSQAVLTEIGNWLAAPPYRRTAVGYLEMLRREPSVEIIPIFDKLFRRGFELYRERQDKAWGLTDCISFIVMHERGIQDALTSDRHFEQAGFNALLRQA